MTGKMFIYRGLPGSGKTALAKANANLNEGRVVGRDHIRAMIGVEGLGTAAEEAEVTRIQSQLITTGLRAGQDVHVDDMNLKSEYVRRLVNKAWREGAEWEIIDLTNVDIDVCHVRNLKRDRVVPMQVIESLYDKFIKNKPYPLPFQFTGARLDQVVFDDVYVPDTELPRAVLIDIDGTVADHDGVRDHHQYDLVYRDKPKDDVIRIVRTVIQSGVTGIFMSGRPDSCEEDTRFWLTKYVAVPERLIMRQTGDRRADYVVKKELFDKHVRFNYNVVGAFDDRNQVVDMYRQLGITVFQVAEGNF